MARDIYFSIHVKLRGKWLVVVSDSIRCRMHACECEWQFCPWQGDSSEPIQWFCPSLKEEYNPVVFNPQAACQAGLTALECVGLRDCEHHHLDDHYVEPEDYYFDSLRLYDINGSKVWGNIIATDALPPIRPHTRRLHSHFDHRSLDIEWTTIMDCRICSAYLNILSQAIQFRYVPPWILDQWPIDNIEDLASQWTREQRISTRKAAISVLLDRLFPGKEGLVEYIQEFLPPPEPNPIRLQFYESI